MTWREIPISPKTSKIKIVYVKTEVHNQLRWTRIIWEEVGIEKKLKPIYMWRTTSL